jgi:hypothetical protein
VQRVGDICALQAMRVAPPNIYSPASSMSLEMTQGPFSFEVIRGNVGLMV